jgi:hypothetical protein
LQDAQRGDTVGTVAGLRVLFPDQVARSLGLLDFK